MSVKYVPWYNPGAPVVRCMKCAAMLTAGDTDVHTKWHVDQQNVEDLLTGTLGTLKRLTSLLVHEKKQEMGLS